MSGTIVNPSMAAAIEAARERAGVDKYHLAIRAGISLNTTRAACQGIATMRTLTLLARALDTDVDTLKGRKGGKS